MFTNEFRDFGAVVFECPQARTDKAGHRLPDFMSVTPQ